MIRGISFLFKSGLARLLSVSALCNSIMAGCLSACQGGKGIGSCQTIESLRVSGQDSGARDPPVSGQDSGARDPPVSGQELMNCLCVVRNH